jgi:hypothetical protein
VKADNAVAPASSALPPPPPPPRQLSRQERLALRITGIAAGALGLAALITGAVFAAQSNSPACDTTAPNCPRTWDNGDEAALDISAGLVLIGGAAALSYYGWRPQKPAATALELRIRF